VNFNPSDLSLQVARIIGMSHWCPATSGYFILLFSYYFWLLGFDQDLILARQVLYHLSHSTSLWIFLSIQYVKGC
jgi:hypothetical protein